MAFMQLPFDRSKLMQSRRPAGEAFGDLTTRARLAHPIEARFSKPRNVFEAAGDLPDIRSA
jgi:hypothetical protein